MTAASRASVKKTNQESKLDRVEKPQIVTLDAGRQPSWDVPTGRLKQAVQPPAHG